MSEEEKEQEYRVKVPFLDHKRGAKTVPSKIHPDLDIDQLIAANIIKPIRKKSDDASA